MVILGVGDGIDAGAALIIDDHVVAVEPQERHDRAPRSRAFPWAAIAEVLEEAGLKNRHVDMIAVAGRFTPPLFLRQHPGLRRAARDAFSPAIDATVFFQALLRQSGLGGVEADYAAEWLETQFRAHGFAIQRVTLVDIHRSLAEAAYRSQARDEVIVITLHPMGDGSAASVHVAADGQLERVWNQKGFEALHVHVRRCLAAMGFEPSLDESRIWALAARAQPDNALLALLGEELSAEGERFSRKSYPFPETRQAPVYRKLAEADRAVAASSVLANLVRAVRGLVRTHVAEVGCPHLVLGGAVFDNPRLCAEMAELDDVESVWVYPTPGYPSLPVGAAASLAGLAPTKMSTPGLGRNYDERQCGRAIAVAGLIPARPADLDGEIAAILAEGGVVARFSGRAGLARHGNGTRSVIYRGDKLDLFDRVRTALGRPDEDEPACLILDDGSDEPIRHAAKLGDALLAGVVAPEVSAAFAASYPGAVTADRRAILQRVTEASDPSLHAVLVALEQREGCAAVGCLPLAQGTDPVVAVPGDAIRIWRRSGADALVLGPFLLRKPR